jgi:phosphatidylglycerophosphatase GEP4
MAWKTLLQTFPNRVLVVSNSAGSAKDRGGIGAESLSFSLRAPVLAHRQPKPACSTDILAFFEGLTVPHTKRDKILERFEKVEEVGDAAEKEMVAKWRDEVVDGPLCGPLQQTHKSGDGGVESRMAAAADAAALAPTPESTTSPAESTPAPAPAAASSDALRILVVGDRLFTDTLLARRLDMYLGSSPSPPTLSIQTTDLPQPNDVRALRRLENWLSGHKLAHDGHTAGIAWSQFVLPTEPAPPVPTWMEKQLTRLDPIKALDDGGPPITWDPRSWRPKPVAAAVLQGTAEATAYLTRLAARVTAQAAKWSWSRFRVWAGAKRTQLSQARQTRAHRREIEKRKARMEQARKAAEAEAEAASKAEVKQSGVASPQAAT